MFFRVGSFQLKVNAPDGHLSTASFIRAVVAPYGFIQGRFSGSKTERRRLKQSVE